MLKEYLIAHLVIGKSPQMLSDCFTDTIDLSIVYILIAIAQMSKDEGRLCRLFLLANLCLFDMNKSDKHQFNYAAKQLLENNPRGG